MIARRPRSQATRRRGVVLILVLSMLGLLAVIGVSFAAFSGQARSAARVYSQKLNRPRADDLIEFAIRQLINDTTNPMSALYGHGLKRDMFGNDAAENGFYDRNPNGSFPTITGPNTLPVPDVTIPPALYQDASPAPAEWTVTTNIPGFVGYNFTGWTLTIPGNAANVAQTFEVVNGTVTGGVYVLRITGSHRPYANVLGTGLIAPNVGSVFSLDGRYRHAFNGSGMAALTGLVNQAMNGPGAPALNDRGNRNPGQFANYRVSGGLLAGNANYTPQPFNVNLLGMDEDYDAPDLENWFLAAQSADGRTMIPSFHRPGILNIDDTGLSDMDYPHPSNFASGTPEYRRAVRAISKILRPRPVDHPTAGFSSLLPDPVTGLIEYDVDNDGDGVAESVWIDLGAKVQRDADGTLYKPLYSFHIVGLNGKLPLNTAGNLNARELVDDPFTPNFDEAGIPLFDHASHVGYSPSEINPKYALQNAFDNFQGPGPVNVSDDNKPVDSQFDNAQYTDPVSGAVVRHIPVNLTQLRSLLTGTRLNPNNDPGEQNFALVNGDATVRLSNNTFDNFDDSVARNGGFSVDRLTSDPVAGRWGEPDAIPPEMRRFIYDPAVDPISARLDRGLNFSGSRVAVDPYGTGTTAVDMPNPVRPGQSPYPLAQYLFDGIDNNTDSVDFYPDRVQQAGPEAGLLNNAGAFVRSNAHDGANMPILASERFQRFISPIDPTGIGMVTRYNRVPVIPPTFGDDIVPYNIGADGRGRVGFMHYFRPPGVALDVDDNSTVDPNLANEPFHRLIPNSGTNTDPSYVLATNRHNAYHGYISALFPGGGNGYLMAGMPYDLSLAGAVFPRDATADFDALPPENLFDPASGTYVGTFSPTINSNPLGRLRRGLVAPGLFQHLGGQAAFQTIAATPVQSYPLGSPLLNDPNEMNLYWPDPNDQPFGPADLEWLYRFGDSDGTSLQSRLPDLAPVSFVAASDSLTRRRMFSVETWDRIDYAFANDHPESLGVVYQDSALHPVPNPSGSIFLDAGPAPGDRRWVPTPFNAALPADTVFLAPGDPSRPAGPLPADLAVLLARQSRPQANARFTADASASFETVGLTNPGVTHGGRRINLNHPFPHSYDPYESVRQKWIGETYEALKAMLPPHAIDTPHELAKLGQFVVNIVDFRDPDNTITIWRNPDVAHLPARRITVGADDFDLPPSIHLPYRADGSADPWYSDALDGAGNLISPLVQYGMEYQPVALNEVLGFRFNFAQNDGAGTFTSAPANRLFIELVNMLSRPGSTDTAANDLDMQGWDFVLVREDYKPTYTAGSPYNHPVYVRPDPITGQIPNADLPAPDELPIVPDGPTVTVNPGQAQAVLVGPGTVPDRADLGTYQDSYRNSALPPADRVEAIQDDGDTDYFVLGGTLTDGGTLTTTPAAEVDAPSGIDRAFAHNTWELIPPVDDPALMSGSEGAFFWLYLRRPANPLLPPHPTDNPMVVVDSVRFPFSASNGDGTTDGTTDMSATSPSQPIYSVQRPQPFRGGQLVPDPEDQRLPLFVYGSSEQVRPAEPNDTDPDTGYRTFFDSPAGGRIRTTNQVYQTIGDQNRSGRFAGGGQREAYDYLPFNDRDFMSVAELTLVPACPPGLFTKQFAERTPTLISSPVTGDNTNDGTVDQLGAFAPKPPNALNLVPLWPDNFTDTVLGVSAPMPHNMVRTYPYLAHEFFYTSDPSAVLDPQDAFATGLPPIERVHLVGGATSAGWHRMLELFEVPSPVLDAIGPVAQGLNFDWFRQDRRPGQLNLNLIFDEEVFFGLLDDPRLLNATQLQRSLIANAAELPRVVTAVDLDGSPLDSAVVPNIQGSYTMGNRGFTVFSSDQRGALLDGNPTSASFPWMQMKRSFSDFLKQRHGGSGFLFAYGDGATGTQGGLGTPTIPKVAHDRPYRSFSYPNIQQTLLRPATLEPSDYTSPVRQVAPLIVQDPGLKDSQYDLAEMVVVEPGFIYAPPDAVTAATDINALYGNPLRVVEVPPGSGTFISKPIVPPVPPRRLFQPPDWTDTTVTDTASNAAVGANQTTEYTPVTNINTAFSTGLFVPSPTAGNYFSLFPEWTYPGFASPADDANVGLGWVDPATGTSAYLGGSVINANITQPGGVAMPIPPASAPSGTWTVDDGGGAGSAQINRDMRRHPYYRTELLQKVSNLTTPRTHQYAVWVTVGLFEVVKAGDRAQFIPDELGPELGVASGANVRYRSFYVLDRTRATGFNPLRPGDYRDVIVYSRRIE